MQTIQEQQPKSLSTFFATEMWERYGYYVVQTLLALYLAQDFGWRDHHVYALVGSFTAITYISPLIGGFIADHLLGQKRSVFLGALILLISYSVLSVLSTKSGLTFCLAGIAVGTGLLKPNVSSLLGNQYAEDSAKRERGFTIFYMGITTGIILGTTIPSHLQQAYGWPCAFASGTIGMFLALLIFYTGVRRFNVQDYHPMSLTMTKGIETLVLVSCLWLGCHFILNYPRFADTIFTAIVVLSAGYVFHILRHESREQSRQTLVIGLLCIISIIFWAFYFQMFMSMTLFVSRVVKPELFGLPFYPPYFVGIQSVGMILFGFFMAKSTPIKSKVDKAKQIGNKFVGAIVLMALAYGSICLVCHLCAPGVLLSPLLFFPTYLAISVAELLLSPVGLSAITLLASRKKVSTLMGIFFVSLGLGGYLSGKLSNIAAIPSGTLSPAIIHTHYTHAFDSLFLMLIAACGLSIFINFAIRCILNKINP